jgi:hypothetical protein
MEDDEKDLGGDNHRRVVVDEADDGADEDEREGESEKG